jgi:ABC-type Fe3+/spermidine/putrescine transport system ATPase subunit
MTSVTLQNIEKRYGAVQVCRVDRLEIGEGEVVTLLGPSGCGKTTTLRIIAGLVAQDSGEIYFGTRNISNVPPERRNAAMVFQNYALFPHMTVRENVAFGLVVRKSPKEHIRARVQAALELVKLPHLADRLPRQLSGGQQQRIAIARALATEPDVLLFDEPLSNLDAKLREYMRFELRKLLDELRITTVYVTHDQTEAMVVSDRIAVMDKGEIVRIDTPHNIYRDPQSRFVADFLGLSSFIPARVAQWDTDRRCGTLLTDDGLKIQGIGTARDGDEVFLCVRPENITLAEVDEAAGTRVNRFVGTVTTAADLGEFIDYQINVGKWQLRAKALSGGRPFRAGERLAVSLDPAACVVVTP